MNTYNFRLLDFIKLKGIAMVVIAIAFFAFAGSADAAITQFEVTSPNGGEYLNGVQTVTWNCDDDGTTPKCSDTTISNIVYSTDGGASYTETAVDDSTGNPYVANSLPASAGSFSWRTTANTESNQGRIKVIMNVTSGPNGDNDESNADFTVDNTPPVINTITTGDTDLDGYIDTVTVTFTDTNPMDTSRTSTSGFNVNGHTITAGAWSGQDFVLTIDETTDKTDAVPQVSYTSPATEADRMQDVAGNDLTDLGATTPTDGAAPAPLSAEIIDHNGDGKLDLVSIKFSEDLGAQVVSGDSENANFTISGSDFGTITEGDAISDSNANGVADSADLSMISYKFSPTNFKTDVGNLEVAFTTASGTKIADGSGNEAASFTLNASSNPAIEDAAAPVAIKAVYRDPDGDGQVDTVDISITESLSINPAVADFSIPTAGTINLAPSAGAQDSDVAFITPQNLIRWSNLTADSNKTGGAVNPKISYTQNTSVFNDNANNALLDFSNLEVQDAASPVVIETATLDTDSDGNVNSIELKFSEDVTDFAGQVGDWALSSDSSTWDAFSNFNTTATVLPGGSDTDANDEYVTLSLTPSNVSGTGVMQYKYANGGTNITDLNGNVLANINATNAADKAAPVVTKIAYTDPNHDGTVDTLNMYLSEPLSTVTPDYGDFGIVGGNIHLAYSHNNNGDITFDATENILKWSHLDADVAKTSAGANNPRITYTQNLGSLTDAAGLEMLNFVHKEAVDEARPVALDAIGTNKSQYTAYGHTGSIDQVLLYFTEPVRTRGGNSSDFDNSAWTETENGLTGFDVTAGADSITDDAFYLTASSDNITGVGAGTEPTLAYGGADYGNATIEDTAGNSAAAFTVNLTDRADPVLVDFVANPNPAGLGDSLGFTLKFSEPMDNTTALTGTTFDTNPSSGPYTVSNINYSGDTWTADFSANPISAGNPKSGTHTFGTPVSSGKDPAGNNMSILSGLDMTFVVDSQRPFTSGLEVTPAVSGLNTPVLVTATIQDDLDLASGSAKLYIEKDDTTVAGPLTMTPGNSSNNGKTKTFTLPIIPSALGLSAGNTYNVYVLGTDSTGNSDLLDIDGDGASDTLTETLTVSSDVTPPAITMTGENTTVNIDADTYAISGAVTPGDFTVVKVFKMIGNTPAPGDVEVGTFALGPSETNWEVTISLPQNATSKYYAEAHDLPNNNTSTTGILTITESDASTDTTAPTLTSTAPDSEQTVGSVADVVFTFADETAFDATASNNIVNFTMDGSDVKTDTKTSASVSGTTLTVTYSDANMPAGVHNFNIKIKDAAGNTREASATVSVVNPNDTLAPTLTYVNTPPVTAITQTTARVVFTSDEGGLAQAAYGTSLSYGNLTPWQVMGASQNTITLGGLSCGTTYHVKIQGKDASSNISETSDATFTTLACSDTTAPEFTSSFSNVVTAGFDVTVSADEAFDVMIEADDDSNFGSVDATIAYSGTTATGPLTKTINGLSADTLYFVRVTVKDAAGNTRSQVYTQQTAQGGPVNLTNLSLSNITDTGATINWTTDNTPASAQYRVSTTAYSGTWNNMSVSGTSGTQNLTGLTPGTTYYYQVSFTKNGQTSYSIPMSFTTASASTGISVDSIQAIKTYASADDNWANGWKWVFNVTVNDMSEHNLAMKFDQWVSGTNTLDAANNMRYSIDDTTWTPISANSTYGANIDISGVDLDASRGGRQVKVYVEMKVPTGTVGGSYSTSYGIQTN